MSVTPAWLAAVQAACDPVFTSADAGFVANPGASEDALLWEADPLRFAARYPNSGVEESYGPGGWPPPCLDFWIYLEPGRARLSLEGSDEHEIIVVLSGDGELDGHAIAAEFARVLAVPAP